MDKIMLDLTKVEKKTEVENACRAQILADLMELLSSRYEGVRRSGVTEFTFPIALASDDDGFAVDVGAVISVKIPKYYDALYKRKTGDKILRGYKCIKAIYDWENDPNTKKKLKKETAGLELAQNSIIPAQEVEYDFDELFEDDDYVRD